MYALSGLAWACPDVAEASEAALRAVDDLYVAEALAHLDRAWEGFGCGPAATPEVLSRFWQAEGAAYLLQGDPERAAASLAAAARVAPDAFHEPLGPEARALFVATPGAPGLLLLEGLARGERARVDGQPYAPEQAAGMHLVQVGPLPKAARYARFVEVTAGGRAVVELPPAPPSAAPGLPDLGRSTWMASGAGLGVVGAGAAFAAAGVAHKAFLATPDPAEAGVHLRRNHAANLAGVALAGAGAGLMGIAVLRAEW